MRTCALITLICLVFSPVAASAQHSSSVAAPPRLIISDKAVADALAAEQPRPRGDRDSLKNGALIGAIAGAAIFGGFVTLLCNALQEPSDPSCLGSSLMGIGIGAGAGALGGAGIDALMYRGGPPAPKVGLPMREGWPINRNAPR
jgi:hypothetical protein